MLELVEYHPLREQDESTTNISEHASRICQKNRRTLKGFCPAQFSSLLAHSRQRFRNFSRSCSLSPDKVFCASDQLNFWAASMRRSRWNGKSRKGEGGFPDQVFQSAVRRAGSYRRDEKRLKSSAVPMGTRSSVLSDGQKEGNAGVFIEANCALPNLDKGRQLRGHTFKRKNIRSKRWYMVIKAIQ